MRTQSFRHGLFVLATFVVLPSVGCKQKSDAPSTTTPETPVAKTDPQVAKTDPRIGKTDPRIGKGTPVTKPGPGTVLPESIVKAWRDSGAEVGWLEVNPGGITLFLPEKVTKGGRLPGFRFTQWTDGRIAKLPDPGSPFGLDLSGCRIPTGAWKELAGLKSLQVLNLARTDAKSDGLKELAGLKGLQSLMLGGNWINDGTLKELAGISSLQTLDLAGSQVTDTGLKELSGLTDLRAINLFGVKVTDAGIKELAGMKNVQTLVLVGTPVTDVGLKDLAGLKSLKSLDLTASKVTAGGVEELRKALPGCEVFYFK